MAHDINQLVLLAQKGPIPVHHLAVVAGHTVSLTCTILPVKLLLRNTYHNITSHCNWVSLISLSPAAANNLLELQQGLSMWNGHVAMCHPPNVVINTNASLSGWGGCILDLKSTVVGWWKPSMQHINELELQAIKKMLYTFETQILGKSILIHCNNIMAITYINKMGGRNPHLNQVMHKIFTFTHAHGINLIARHLPGVVNVHADKLSRLLPQHKWRVHPSIFNELQWKWGLHTIDHMAMKRNTLLPHFNLRFWERHVEAMDTLLQDWTHNNNWVAPPLVLLPVVVQLLQQQNTWATVLAPVWISKAWCQELLELCNVPLQMLPHPAPLILLSGMALEPLQCGNWCIAAFRTSGKPTPLAGAWRPWECSMEHWPPLHGGATGAA